MAASTKEKAPDSQAEMTNFVQTFARPQATTPPPAMAPESAATAAPPGAAPAAALPAAIDREPVDNQAEDQPTSGKKKAAADENASWADVYLQPVRPRKTKAIYVDEDTHNALTLITQDAGCGLADLLINVLNVHFDTFRPEIRQFLAEQEKLKKKKNPF